jgi:hypothetical protein
MFSQLRRAKVILPFLGERIGDYAQLVRFDLLAFQKDMINSIVGAVVCAAAMLLLLCFVSLAVIVTEWGTVDRIGAAWAVCCVWAFVAATAAIVARRLMRGSSAFAHVETELLRDLSVIRGPLEETIDA